MLNGDFGIPAKLGKRSRQNDGMPPHCLQGKIRFYKKRGDQFHVKVAMP